MDEKEQLPRWQSHKKVWADKIVAAIPESPSMHGHWDLLCGGSRRVSLQLARRVPDGLSPVGGYYVRYEDGYESWSPAKAFEEGYTRIPELVPRAIWQGTFTVFGVRLRCFVLDDEAHTRVIIAEDITRLFEVMGLPFALGFEPGDLEEFNKWQQRL